MKTSELTGPALDWAVAKCEEIDLRGDPLIHGKDVGNLVYRPRPDYHEYHWEHWKPTTDWSQGGPIIEREEITIASWYCDGKFSHWEANGHDLEYDEVGEYIHGSDYAQTGPTPLIAAMRCFVASKLGDEVEIPEELA